MIVHQSAETGKSKESNSLYKANIDPLFLFIITALLGLISIILPPLFLPLKHYESPIFPLVATGIEGASFLTVIFLIISGIIPGILSPKSIFKWGLAIASIFPFLAIAEILVDSSSHNLWPIEFVLSYGTIAIVGTVGVILGRLIRELF